jgi:hypothetical protein
MVRRSTLDVLGIGLLLVFAVAKAWPHLDPQVMDGWGHYGPHIATCLGILFAAVPLWMNRPGVE